MSSGRSLAQLIRPSTSESTMLYFPIEVVSLWALDLSVAGVIKACLGCYAIYFAISSSLDKELAASSNSSSPLKLSRSAMSSIMLSAWLLFPVLAAAIIYELGVIIDWTRSRPALTKASAFLNLLISTWIWSVKNFLVSISCRFWIMSSALAA